MSEFSFPALIESIGLKIDDLTNRQKVEVIEYALAKKYKNIAKELPVTDTVCNGIYYRELFIPADVALTGKVHREKHLCMLLSGDISVLTDDGMKRIQAPYTFVSEPEMKRAGYAHTDCIFATVHQTELTDIQQIEEALFYDSDLSWIEETLKLSGDKEYVSSRCSGGS